MQTHAIKIRAWDDPTMTWTCDDWNDKPYMRWAGVRVQLAEGGHSRVELQVEPHHRGAMDTDSVNGAILAYLHDVAQGAAIRSVLGDDVRAIATLKLNISYVAAMTGGAVLEGVGRAIAVHNAVAFAESEFRGARSEVCGRASGTFRILRKRMKSVHAH
jgi:acyl-coenzyme A thioesterase PaaI-like protein